MNTSILLGNPYFMLFLSAVVEMPSYVLTTLIMDKTGRRSLTSALMIIGAISCLISVTIPQGNELHTTTTDCLNHIKTSLLSLFNC